MTVAGACVVATHPVFTFDLQNFPQGHFDKLSYIYHAHSPKFFSEYAENKKEYEKLNLHRVIKIFNDQIKTLSC